MRPNATEVRERWRRLQTGLAHVGLDLLLLTSEANFEFATGLTSPTWLSRARPMFLLILREGVPIPIVSPSIAVELAATGLFRDCRTYGGLEEAATTELIATIHDSGLARGRIGLELGTEQRLGMTPVQYNRFVRSCPGLDIRDAAPLIWQVRMLKSSFELDCLQIAGGITGEAFRVVESGVRAGMTEQELCSLLCCSCLERGANKIGYVAVSGGPGHYDLAHARHDDRRLVSGELLWMDAGCAFQSYFADFSRCFALNSVSRTQEKTYHEVYEALQETLNSVRPGVTAADVYAAAMKAAKRLRIDLSNPTRVGHGIGLNGTEPPSLASWDNTLIESGMALAVEVGVLNEDGYFQLEDNLVVREHGFELLSSPTPARLSVVPEVDI